MVQVRLWTVEDVCRWLDTLRLGQYKQAFKEASVDGEFLLELREEDMMQVRRKQGMHGCGLAPWRLGSMTLAGWVWAAWQVLGMEHKLHVRKVILARAKLTPLSEEDVAKKVRYSPARGQYDRALRAGLLTSWCGGVAAQLIVEREEKAKQMREQGGPASNANLVLEVDVVFSQARNGRMKRLEESLNMGYVGGNRGRHYWPGRLLARADGCLAFGVQVPCGQGG